MNIKEKELNDELNKLYFIINNYNIAIVKSNRKTVPVVTVHQHLTMWKHKIIAIKRILAD